MKTIKFKSNKNNYPVEESDLKNNTVRFTSDWDDKRWDKFRNATHIEIESRDKGRKFKREIRHKCEYGAIIIITWEPLASKTEEMPK